MANSPGPLHHEQPRAAKVHTRLRWKGLLLAADRGGHAIRSASARCGAAWVANFAEADVAVNPGGVVGPRRWSGSRPRAGFRDSSGDDRAHDALSGQDPSQGRGRTNGKIFSCMRRHTRPGRGSDVTIRHRVPDQRLGEGGGVRRLMRAARADTTKPGPSSADCRMRNMDQRLARERTRSSRSASPEDAFPRSGPTQHHGR